jgi:catechol 2,3-dioxygenase-like lactoylglutathione lyase family enzyme
MKAPAHTGAWSEAVVSVSDLNRWADALGQLFGWSEVLRGPVDDRLLRAWRLPASVTAEQRLVANLQDDTRRVRLITFAGAEQRQIRSSGAGWDTGGIFSLLCYARDVDETFRQAQRLGWSAYHDPVDMEFGDRVLRNVVLRAWDGVNFGLYRQTRPALAEPPVYAKVGAPFNGQQMVRAIGPARDFYAQGLGWTAWYDGETRLTCNNFGMPENFAGKLPKQVVIMSGSRTPQGTWDYGQVELVQWEGFAGRDFTDYAVPPNLGVLSLRIPVADASSVADALRSRGLALFVPPTEVALPPHQDVTVCAVRTPDGALIEFFSGTATPARR